MSSNPDQGATTPPADQEIAYVKIHPGVGIARIGNSPDEFFIGPLAPGETPSPEGGFKDPKGRIKPQAVEFRLFAYNRENVALKELTAEDGEIIWSVHLANRKPVYDMFLGKYWQSQYPDFLKSNPARTPPRNQEIAAAAEREKLLVIDPGPRTISGRNQQNVKFDTGTIGPLPYTVVLQGVLDESDPGNPQPTSGNQACIKGSRTGYLNEIYESPDNAPPVECRDEWVPGKVIPPVALSRKATVPLGELRTDGKGRLVVIGGRGVSESLIPDNPVGFLNIDSFFANNDYWFDDTSDGPITASVALKDGKKLEAVDKAWVLVAPPKYAPAARVLTTLYEVSMETWEKKAGIKPSDPVSFTSDIYPVLERQQQYHWLNAAAYRGHGPGPGQGGDFLVDKAKLKALHTKGASNLSAKTHIFNRLRKPGLVAATPDSRDTPESLTYANTSFMPQLSGDGGEPQMPEDNPPGSPVFGSLYVTWLTLTVEQYRKFELWAKDEFEDDWNGPPKFRPIWDFPVAQQPAMLDKGALDPCVGGAFYPGIEMTYISTEPDSWSGPCRINQSWSPGSVTMHMALPWQADFSECNTNWWPAQRPDNVVPESEYLKALETYDEKLQGSLEMVLASRPLWSRGIPQLSPALDNAMVHAWKDFGFVVPKKYPRDEPGAQTVYIETERSPYIEVTERDAFYYLMNIENYPNFLPKAHEMVEEYLRQARRNADEVDSDEVFQYFDYSQIVFDARMQLIYDNFVRDNQRSQGSEYSLGSTKEQVAYRLLQMGPFNQLDGAWLRKITPDGPLDTINELLFRIRMDELGDGNVEQNHANVYTDLLKSLNFYLPDLHTREYADNPALLNSAFTQPVFLLAISEFADEFFPELLGMTLELEWGSVSLVSSVVGLEAFGINPLYYQLHVGIDNASVGHGALAKKAIEMYLDLVRQDEGEAAMQSIWQRIWTGYIAFATLGTLGADIAARLSTPPSLAQQLQNMIKAKAPYGSLMHGQKTLGSSRINNWFEDPAGFLVALQESGIVIPGKPDISPLFQLMGFNGPMYHVFTDDEVALWRNWVVSLAAPQPVVETDPYKNMKKAIDILRQRQEGTSGHNVQLTGPDPDHAGAKVTQKIHWWFDLLNTHPEQADDLLMGALSEPENGWISPGNAGGSLLLTAILSGNGDMATALRAVCPDTGGLTYQNVMVNWIDAGCPIGAPKPVLFAEALAAAPEKPVRKKRKMGMGVVH